MKKRNTPARRRVSLRSTLCMAMLSLGLSVLFFHISSAFILRSADWMPVQLLAEMICFLLPAYFGLSVLDGNQVRMIRLQKMQAGKMVDLFLAGMMMAFPYRLFSDVWGKILPGFWNGVRMDAVPTALFLPSMLYFMLLRPFSEMLFFDGYLSDGLSRLGKWQSTALVLLLFTLVKGLTEGFLPALLLGIPLLMSYRQAQSLLAPSLFYAGMGFAEFVLGQIGHAGLFNTSGMLVSFLRIAGTALGIFFFARAYRIAPMEERLAVPERIGLTQKEKQQVLTAAIAVLLAILTAEVLQ